jgi:uncharacterized membrane protein YtjA (UPF0391 family)
MNGLFLDPPVTWTVPKRYALHFLRAQPIPQSLLLQLLSASPIQRSAVSPARAKAVRLSEIGTGVRGAETFSASVRSPGKELTILYYALMFLVVGLIAGALNLAGVAAVATQISWGLFLIGLVLLVIHLVTGLKTPH